MFYFNPRPREEGDGIISPIAIVGDISIHALVKRATHSRQRTRKTAEISIHALVKRATIPQSQPFIVGGISIHALVKRATKNSVKVFDVIDISIHALVKRATRSGAFFVESSFHFNPRPREEGDYTM